MNTFIPENTDVVILCGGLGKRLRSVLADIPKPMASINGQPFLDLLMDYCARFGFKRFILCVGYKAEKIIDYYEKSETTKTILFSREDEPMGTGGGMALAVPLVKSSHFLGLNGDSMCLANLRDFGEFHFSRQADLSIVLSEMDSNKDFGMISMDKDQRLTSFSEKKNFEGKAFVNAGIYLFNKDTFKGVSSDKPFSLEYDFFPGMLNKKVFGYKTKEKLIDIGSPERLEEGKRFFSRP